MPSRSYSGYWMPKYPPPDLIRLSRQFFPSFSQEARDAVAAHERGQALRLEHQHFDNAQLMEPHPERETENNPRVTRPRSHDIEDYYNRWPSP